MSNMGQMSSLESLTGVKEGMGIREELNALNEQMRAFNQQLQNMQNAQQIAQRIPQVGTGSIQMGQGFDPNEQFSEFGQSF